MAEEVTREQVRDAITDLLIRFERGDLAGTARQFDDARNLFDEWLRGQPEKKEANHG